MIDAPMEVGTTGFLQANIAGALAYVTPIPPIVFLRIMPFKRNQFVRFHSWQSIFLLIAGILVGLGLKLIFSILALIPRFGYLFAWLAVMLVSLAWLFIWLVAMIKAFNRELFKLPVIGDFAERA